MKTKMKTCQNTTATKFTFLVLSNHIWTLSADLSGWGHNNNDHAASVTNFFAKEIHVWHVSTGSCLNVLHVSTGSCVNKRPKGPQIVHLSTMYHLFEESARAAIFVY